MDNEKVCSCSDGCPCKNGVEAQGVITDTVKVVTDAAGNVVEIIADVAGDTVDTTKRVVINIAEFVKDMINGPLISELMKLAIVIRATTANDAIVKAIIDAGVPAENAPALVGTVTGVVLIIEALIKNATNSKPQS